MAAGSLTRMTVPLASNGSASTQGLLMPKLQYRFRISFEDFGVSFPTSELTKQVVDFTRPSVTMDAVEIPVYNSVVYYAGKPKWTEVKTTIRDDALGNVSRLVGEQLQKQFDYLEQSSASSGIDYKFRTRCEILDGGNGANTPETLETWELYGCFLSNVEYGQLNYGTNEPVTIVLTIRYDNALQTPLGSGIGKTVIRTLGKAITG